MMTWHENGKNPPETKAQSKLEKATKIDRERERERGKGGEGESAIERKHRQNENSDQLER